jgi:hypothetical protein
MVRSHIQSLKWVAGAAWDGDHGLSSIGPWY